MKLNCAGEYLFFGLHWTGSILCTQFAQGSWTKTSLSIKRCSQWELLTWLEMLQHRYEVHNKSATLLAEMKDES